MPDPAPTSNALSDLLGHRVSRRRALAVGGAGITAVAAARTVPAGASLIVEPTAGPVSFVPLGDQDADADGERVADGYRSNTLIRWGDPLSASAPAFDVDAQSAEAQSAQFGFNCDFLHLSPLGLPGLRTTRYLLTVNHEYTSGNTMIPGYPAEAAALAEIATAEPAKLAAWAAIEWAAHGLTIVEVTHDRRSNQWSYVRSSSSNRRITATTPMRISGPASTDPRVGTTVRGTLNNCAGGHTPWGTVLTAEENFNQYFANNDTNPDAKAKETHAAYGIGGGASARLWERVDERFDVSKQPNEPFRFGWVVEVDPHDPGFTPTKRTALGRFKHEGAVSKVTKDLRVAFYSGDDERGQFLYKFVTAGKLRFDSRTANRELLDTGVLHVARFEADGTGRWLPLAHAVEPAVWEDRGFADQADICIRTRQAAAALGATKMDRPEDVDVNPVNGRIYMACTNNSNRKADVAATAPGEAAANPRFDATAGNRHGHILEIGEDGDDSGSMTFTWDVFALCGPGDVDHRVASPDAAESFEDTWFAGYTGAVSTIAAPDNFTFDRAGNLVIATDGMPSAIDQSDGVFFTPTAGPERGRVKRLYGAPAGAEVCGPLLAADDRSLFLAIQHPGEEGAIEDGQHPQDNSQSRWPDSTVTGSPAIPRPSVVVVTRRDGGRVGS